MDDHIQEHLLETLFSNKLGNWNYLITLFLSSTTEIHKKTLGFIKV